MHNFSVIRTDELNETNESMFQTLSAIQKGVTVISRMIEISYLNSRELYQFA